MKKLALLLLALFVVVFAFASCEMPDTGNTGNTGDTNGGEVEDNRPTYSITFKTGTKDVTVEVKEGDMPTPPEVPDADYGDFYKRLKGWDKEIVPATEDTTYTAQFETVKKEVTATFITGDTFVEVVTYSSYVPKAPTEVPDYNGMKFLCWDREIGTIKEDTTFTAVYYDPELIGADYLLTAYNRHLMGFAEKVNQDDNSNSTLYTATMLYTLVWHEHMNPQGGALSSRIIEHLTSVTSPDKAPSFDACCYWNYNPLTASIALVRTTPSVWNNLPADIQMRLGTMMLGFSYLESFATSDYNSFQTGPGMGGNFHKDWNPNYRLANVPTMVYATYFFGAGDIELGAETVNSNIKSFDENAYTTIINTFSKYGWRRAVNRWTSEARTTSDGKTTGGSAKELMVNGGTAVGEDTSIESELKVVLGYGTGVANRDTNGKGRDYLYKGLSLYEPWKIIQHVITFNYGGGSGVNGAYEASSYLTVKSDHWFDVDSDGIKDLVAWIKDETESPYYGREGMMLEFASGNRSSTAYTTHDFVLTTITLTACRAMELYTTENGKKIPLYNEDGTAQVLFDYTKNEKLWNAIQVGNEDHIYKLIHGYMGYSTGSYGVATHEGNEVGSGIDYWVCKSIWRTYMMKDGTIELAESFSTTE